jgi:hypothetical protein
MKTEVVVEDVGSLLAESVEDDRQSLVKDTLDEQLVVEMDYVLLVVVVKVDDS